MQSALNGTSTEIEFAMILPTSSVSKRAISSTFSRMSSAKRSRTFFLWRGAASRQTPLSKAARVARFHRPVDVGRAAIGDMGDDPAVDGRNFGESLAVERGNIGAVDEGAAFDLGRRGAGELAFASGGTIEH
jgi:hypothetical protein